MNAQEPLRLDELGDAYEIVAELGGRENARVFRARYHGEGKRRDDVSDVLIAVSRAPRGDEKNALSLYAADTRLLTRLPHRNLLRTLGGQWIGTDAFAVITEYPQHPSLAELLAHGEEFSYPRIAAILQEVNGLLEWARAENVVHRGVSATTLFLMPETDRALVSFDITAIPLTGPLLPEVDARTLAALAWTMFTRSAPPKSLDEMVQPLAELRPDLSTRAVQQTEALLGLSQTKSPLPDAAEYIATIAIAGAMKAGELEVARVEAEVTEQRRRTQEELEAERQEAERLAAEEAKRIAEQRESFANTVEREREELAAQRAELEREIAEQREELQRSFAAEREELQRSMAAEREELQRAVAAERAALEQERAAFLAQREEVEANLAAERERLAAERAELEQHRADVEQYWVEAEQRVRGLDPVAAEAILDREREDSGVPLGAGVLTPVDLPEELAALGDDVPPEEAAVWESQLEHTEGPAAERPIAERPIDDRSYLSASPYDGDSSRTRWAMVGGGVALLGLIVTAAISMTHREPSAETPAGVARHTVVDSAAGVAALRTATPPVAPAAVDTAPAAADSVPTPPPPRRRRALVAVVRDTAARDSMSTSRAMRADSLVGFPVRRDSTLVTDSTGVRRDTMPRRDSTGRRDSMPRRDTTSRRDATVRPDTRDTTARRDTTVRRDSVARPDTIVRPRPDTVPRPDTGMSSLARPRL